jgi:hypothetical protein
MLLILPVRPGRCYDGLHTRRKAGLTQMADIFISYKTERRKAAEHFADLLKLYGYSAWFDYDLIKGSDFGPQLAARIREAKTLIALWCSRSVHSRWVVEECDLAHERGILIPVVIEPCELPIGFRRHSRIDLSSYRD